MAVFAPTSLTLADVAKVKDPSGKMGYIVETLNETNEVLTDMKLVECNNGTFHKTIRRTSLPKGGFRRAGEGAVAGKSVSVPIQDETARYEAIAEIDEMVVDNSGLADPTNLLLSESRAFLNGMNNDMAFNLFYGSKATDAAAFDGLFTRYGKISGNDALTAGQIISNGGSGSTLTSMALCVWGDDAIVGLYPKGSTAGLQHNDLGKETVIDPNNSAKRFRAYRQQYIWNIGLCVRDLRQFSRLCNIDFATVTSSAANKLAFLNKLIEMEERVHNLKGGNAVIYCNRRIMTMLRQCILERVSSQLTHETVAGMRVTMWNGIPIRQCDEIVNTETTIS